MYIYIAITNMPLLSWQRPTPAAVIRHLLYCLCKKESVLIQFVTTCEYMSTHVVHACEGWCCVWGSVGLIPGPVVSCSASDRDYTNNCCAIYFWAGGYLFPTVSGNLMSQTSYTTPPPPKSLIISIQDTAVCTCTACQIWNVSTAFVGNMSDLNIFLHGARFQ